jgi:hypothetical protein
MEVIVRDEYDAINYIAPKVYELCEKFSAAMSGSEYGIPKRSIVVDHDETKYIRSDGVVLFNVHKGTDSIGNDPYITIKTPFFIPKDNKPYCLKIFFNKNLNIYILEFRESAYGPNIDETGFLVSPCQEYVKELIGFYEKIRVLISKENAYVQLRPRVEVKTIFKEESE